MFIVHNLNDVIILIIVIYLNCNYIGRRKKVFFAAVIRIVIFVNRRLNNLLLCTITASLRYKMRRNLLKLMCSRALTSEKHRRNWTSSDLIEDRRRPGCYIRIRSHWRPLKIYFLVSETLLLLLVRAHARCSFSFPFHVVIYFMHTAWNPVLFRFGKPLNNRFLEVLLNTKRGNSFFLRLSRMFILLFVVA